MQWLSDGDIKKLRAELELKTNQYAFILEQSDGWRLDSCARGAEDSDSNQTPKAVEGEAVRS
jgi:hypothetical protein